MDAFAKKLGAEESKAEGGSDAQKPQEQQGNYRSFSMPQENMHKMATNIAEMASSYLEKEGIAELASSFLNAHMPGNFKPALRFVRHVTCPDGTLVPPSVPFCKTWRVRNDGKIAWPEGSVLVHSSGDQLTYEESAALETLPGPGEEVDITINLKCKFYISFSSNSDRIDVTISPSSSRLHRPFRVLLPHADQGEGLVRTAPVDGHHRH